ncbi:MAG: glycosyltransferase, partial [Burkholderiales bacterium]|nr:glycosyltransferase [Burkholderiales bacterium]
MISRRQAAALSRGGFDVCVAAPTGEKVAGDPFDVEIYATGTSSRDHFGPKCFDAQAVSALRKLIDRFRPDVLYDVHGPPWAVDAASQAGVPVVSMMGDYNWYCLTSFLVDSRLHRCSGPESVEKCFSCVNRWHPFRRRAVHAVLKPAARAGLARFHLWDRLNESSDYLARMRARITTFVVGDQQASDFLVRHGVPPAKIVR